MRTLSSLTTRLCDPTQTSASKGKEVLGIALPFLLQKGLVNEADEVKTFSLTQILKIAKVAGSLLTPHVPELVGVLLEGLTSLEPAALSYMSFHTERMNISQEQLEQARISISNLTPMNDTLDICAKHVENSNVEELVVKLVELIKSGVGLPTRVGTAKFISSLSVIKSEELKPYAGKIVNALVLAAKDRSPSVRKAYASALASVSKFSSAKTIKRLVDKLCDYYTQMEVSLSGSLITLERRFTIVEFISFSGTGKKISESFTICV